jgi:tetratricopeptide (TPR) repeat protein
MKALILATAVIGLSAGSSANASTLTIGGSLARTCFEAAEARNATLENLQTCDQALAQEELTSDDQVATYVNRGILRLVAGDFKNADADFDRAITMDPREPEAWLNKAVSRIRQGNSASAVPMLARAIELKTRRPALAFYTRALANEDRGDVRAAYADFVRARELDPAWDLPAKELRRYQVRQR